MKTDEELAAIVEQLQSMPIEAVAAKFIGLTEQLVSREVACALLMEAFIKLSSLTVEQFAAYRAMHAEEHKQQLAAAGVQFAVVIPGGDA